MGRGGPRDQKGHKVSILNVKNQCKRKGVRKPGNPASLETKRRVAKPASLSRELRSAAFFFKDLVWVGRRFGVCKGRGEASEGAKTTAAP